MELDIQCRVTASDGRIGEAAILICDQDGGADVLREAGEPAHRVPHLLLNIDGIGPGRLGIPHLQKGLVDFFFLPRLCLMSMMYNSMSVVTTTQYDGTIQAQIKRVAIR